MALNVNVKQGLFRLWLSLTVAWVAFSTLLLHSGELDVILLPPLVLAAMGATAIWIVYGFTATKKPSNKRRVWVTAKGLLFRFELPDGSIVIIPTVQIFNDAEENPGLLKAMVMWGAGQNGPIDSLPQHPEIRAYLYNWAVDWSYKIWESRTLVDPEERAMWVAPDLSTVWFLLPDEEVVWIPFSKFVDDITGTDQLAKELYGWMTAGAPVANLGAKTILLHYLGSEKSAERAYRGVLDAMANAKTTAS